MYHQPYKIFSNKIFSIKIIIFNINNIKNKYMIYFEKLLKYLIIYFYYVSLKYKLYNGLKIILAKR